MTDFEMSEKLKGFDTQNSHLLFNEQSIEEDDYSEYSEENIEESVKDDSVKKKSSDQSIKDSIEEEYSQSNFDKTVISPRDDIIEEEFEEEKKAKEQPAGSMTFGNNTVRPKE